MLDGAIEIAIRAHFGQVDKAGEPYILHPFRVMLSQEGEAARVVGVLHDAVEDSELSLDDLAFEYEFPHEIVEAVDSVTRREGEDYFEYVARAKANPIGRKVKVADLNDNMDPKRRPASDPNCAERMAKYDRALCFLLDKTIVKDAA
ncbi:GTP pyrophosphokinase [Mesorhizobium sp. BR1-1-12]|uniref:GTP pyrophosphokinase n=1 Tax=Mesorhizobium sp. BR1-1-12 TaxID=2876657 RepID=UPI001CD09143|nr:GTP pyrophosphokinase [Mesorhizobium sp. BR1-1-12]MBZ9973544.1 GTP pyrophosphokinase [Mesorhizobium sp. BR1-1-12]